MSGHDGFRWEPATGGDVLVCTALADVAPHVFTTRALGPAATEEERETAYRAVATRLRIDPGHVRDARQVHGTAVHVAGPQVPPVRPEADVLMTIEPAVAVVVRVADCTPVLLADQRTGAVAAVHAGWRGTCAGASMTAVGAMADHFGCRPSDLVAAIGPSIGPCCYQVGRDVYEAFLSQDARLPAPGRWFRADGERWRLDVRAANRDQLRSAGVPARSIFTAPDCTACSRERYFSYRAEGAAAGRQLAAIRPSSR